MQPSASRYKPIALHPHCYQKRPISHSYGSIMSEGGKPIKPYTLLIISNQFINNSFSHTTLFLVSFFFKKHKKPYLFHFFCCFWYFFAISLLLFRRICVNLHPILETQHRHRIKSTILLQCVEQKNSI